MDRLLEERIRDLESVLSTVPMGVCAFDQKLRYIYTNEWLATWNGFGRVAHLGRTVDEIPPPLGKDAKQLLRRVMDTGIAVLDGLVENEEGANPGEPKQYQINIAPLMTGDGSRTLGATCTLQDVTMRVRRSTEAAREREAELRDEMQKRENAERQVRHLAYYDGLTGLPNRNRFHHLLEDALERADSSDTDLALLFLDIDNFKEVNDSLGHAAGDLFLCEIASRLNRRLRPNDLLAQSAGENSEQLSRFGGDEFAIILRGLSNSTDAGAVARRLLKETSRPLGIEGQTLYPKASVGIAVFPDDGRDAATLLKAADTAMYQAKADGRNGIRFYNESANRTVQKRFRVAHELQQALGRNEFVLYYQPIRQTSTGIVSSAEALIRWAHPELGLVPPDEFIPIAEETGTIVSIDEWALRTACLQARAWQDEGFQAVRIAVNVSPPGLLEASWSRKVKRVLGETALSPTLLEIEITERLSLRQSSIVASNIDEVTSIGVGLVLDDFGTGFSSISNLNRIPIQRIKIDREFVNGVPSSRRNTVLAKAIVALAQSLGLKVTAEGVETEEQVRFLRQWGCDHLQGYLISPPVPAHEFNRFLRRTKRE